MRTKWAKFELPNMSKLGEVIVGEEDLALLRDRKPLNGILIEIGIQKIQGTEILIQNC